MCSTRPCHWQSMDQGVRTWDLRINNMGHPIRAGAHVCAQRGPRPQASESLERHHVPKLLAVEWFSTDLGCARRVVARDNVSSEDHSEIHPEAGLKAWSRTEIGPADMARRDASRSGTPKPCRPLGQHCSDITSKFGQICLGGFDSF